MKQYIASVKDKETGKIKIIRAEYKTKKHFAEDIKSNGYALRFIATEDTFDEVCEKYHMVIERQKQIRKYVREYQQAC